MTEAKNTMTYWVPTKAPADGMPLTTAHTVPCEVRVSLPKPYDELILEQLGDSAIELLVKEVARRRADQISLLEKQLSRERDDRMKQREEAISTSRARDIISEERNQAVDRCKAAEQVADHLRKNLDQAMTTIRKMQRRHTTKNH